MLTAAHEPLIRAAALNHISPYFADVVWDGLSTAHVRESLDGRIDLDALRRIWMPISPFPYLERMRGKRVLLVYARYDLTFPVDAVAGCWSTSSGGAASTTSRPCCRAGTTAPASAPFKWIDGFVLCRFLSRSL